MHKNHQGQDVRDDNETDEWVREALKSARTEAEFITYAQEHGVPGRVALVRYRALEASGALERVGARRRIRRGGA